MASLSPNWSLSIREAVDLASASAREKAIRIELAVPDSPVVVSGDAEALRRAVFILIDNAVKYSSNGAAVSVTVGSANGTANCRVADHGIGIASSDLPHVFDRFWRADKVRSRGMGGAGLGLSIAKWIAERHGGAISVTSEPAQGSQFEIYIQSQGAL